MQNKARVSLRGEGKTVLVEGVFSTGSPTSMISADLARALGTFTELDVKDRYEVPTLKKGVGVEVVGKSVVVPELAGCRQRVTVLDVVRDLPTGRNLLVGREDIDRWQIEFTEQGPRPRTCCPERGEGGE